MPRILKPCRRKKTVSFRKLIAPLKEDPEENHSACIERKQEIADDLLRSVACTDLLSSGGPYIRERPYPGFKGR